MLHAVSIAIASPSLPSSSSSLVNLSHFARHDIRRARISSSYIKHKSKTTDTCHKIKQGIILLSTIYHLYRQSRSKHRSSNSSQSTRISGGGVFRSTRRSLSRLGSSAGSSTLRRRRLVVTFLVIVAIIVIIVGCLGGGASKIKPVGWKTVVRG